MSAAVTIPSSALMPCPGSATVGITQHGPQVNGGVWYESRLARCVTLGEHCLCALVSSSVMEVLRVLPQQGHCKG